MRDQAGETALKKESFLEVLADVCSVTTTCKLVGVGRATVYRWREADAEFRLAWDKSRALGVDALEDEAVRRAMEGVERPVLKNGVPTGHFVREFSDTLLIFLLKGAKPEKYRDRVSTEISGPAGRPLEIDDATAAAKLATILSTVQKRAERDVSDLV